MKLFAPTAFALATLTALSSADSTASVASDASASNAGSAVGSESGSGSGSSGSVDIYDAGASDAGFNGTLNDHDGATNTTNHIKTAAHLMGSGAKIQLCPSGDCVNGQVIMLSMSRLQEIDDSSKPFVQEAKNFQAVNATWTPFEPLVINGTDALSASFVTTFKVDKNQVEATSFNLTAVIYQSSGTAMNGNQTVDVPAGALKFSVTITKWPFVSKTNRLRFGVELKATGKGGAERDPPVDAKPKGGRAKDVDRLDMGEGMYMDAPTQAVVDGVNTAINASIVPQNKKLELVWVFPSFETDLFYDPVMGSEDPSASATTTTTTAPSVNGSTSASASASASATGSGSTSTSASTDGSGSLAASGSGSQRTSSTTGSGSVASSTAGSGSVAAGANSTVAPTPTATMSTPTPSPTTATTHTDTKTSGTRVLGATVLGALVAAAVGGTLFV